MAGGVQLNAVVTTGAATAGAVSAPAAVQFEAAKAASAQRSATNMAMADQALSVRSDANVQRAGNVTFVLRDSVWTDVRYKNAGPVLRVKAFSDAYFKLLELQPDLREPFSIGDRAIVAGRSMAIELAPTGVERLSDRDLAMLKDRW
jgi:hypothetical protein